MSRHSLDASILSEMRRITGKPKLRQKDILAWSSGGVRVDQGEKHFFLPDLKIHVVVDEEKVK